MGVSDASAALLFDARNPRLRLRRVTVPTAQPSCVTLGGARLATL